MTRMTGWCGFMTYCSAAASGFCCSSSYPSFSRLCPISNDRCSCSWSRIALSPNCMNSAGLRLYNKVVGSVLSGLSCLISFNSMRIPSCWWRLTCFSILSTLHAFLKKTRIWRPPGCSCPMIWSSDPNHWLCSLLHLKYTTRLSYVTFIWKKPHQFF